MIGERGRLITSDVSPSMLEAARRRGAERGVDNVEYRLIDAERIELDADSVDGVLCRLGYMLMADPAAAFRETRRVLRRGGRLTLAVWGALERNPFFGIIGMSLGQRGHIPTPEPPPARPSDSALKHTVASAPRALRPPGPRHFPSSRRANMRPGAT